jgi:hypothetical protein
MSPRRFCEPIPALRFRLQFTHGEKVMKQLLATLLVVSVVLVGAAPFAVAAPPQQMGGEKSLYTRLGGYDALVAVTQDFIGRLATEPSLYHVLYWRERHLQGEGGGPRD